MFIRCFNKILLLLLLFRKIEHIVEFKTFFIIFFNKDIVTNAILYIYFG